jgi:hypothetical protein
VRWLLVCWVVVVVFVIIVLIVVGLGPAKINEFFESLGPVSSFLTLRLILMNNPLNTAAGY